VPTRLGVDVGGTFTDVVVDDGERVAVSKVPSTPGDQAEGVLDGLATLEVDLTTVGRFVHGTTVATNALLERRGARTVLVTTEGFRDLLEIGRQNRPSLYDLFADRPPPIVPGGLVVEAPERVTAEGGILRPLDDPDAVAEAVAALEPEAVAVCLLFSFLRPEHEEAIGSALADLGVPVSLSSEVLPVFREYERANTTALNAYVAPTMARYLASLAERLHEGGLSTQVEVMRSGGGTASAETAARFPVHTLLSGPAAGAWGAAAVAYAAGFDDVIAFDMGGTSTDATLIEGGRPRTSAEGRIGGLPFAVASTEIHTVGSGGGSIAWRDDGGSLRVGPRSAGADPGPACYGRGGVEPTVTDAYAALGLLDPDAPLGGVVRIDRQAALRALETLAAPLGLDVEACAAGILRVVDAQIEKALRVVSVEQGRDPREFALLAFGGAGPVHQGPLARALGCRAVVVPRHPGVLSAMGLLAAPVATEAVRTSIRDLTSLGPQDLRAGWVELESRVRGELAAQGSEVARLRWSADCRYRGQGYELDVEAPADGDPAALGAAFHRRHRERYGYDHADGPVEVVNLKVRGEGPPPRPALPPVAPGRGASAARSGTRRATIDGHAAEVSVFDRDRLGHGDRVEGPAVVASTDSTCVLLPGQIGGVDPIGNLVVTEG
jgi:N-methylhydantoinase A